MSSKTLEIESLDVLYGSVMALQRVNIVVEQKEVVVVVGSNGAGKTTLMKAMVGLKRPRSGKITLRGEEISGLPVHQIVRKGISLVPEGRWIFGDQSVLENLILGTYGCRPKISGTEIEDRVDRCFSRFPAIRDRRHQLAGSLSGGLQQMVAISRGLMSNPSVLLIDEPSLGLAPIIIEQVFKTVKDLNQEGITVMLVEQMATLALNIAHRGYVLEHGIVVLQEDAEKLLHNPQVIESYLGKK